MSAAEDMQAAGDRVVAGLHAEARRRDIEARAVAVLAQARQVVLPWWAVCVLVLWTVTCLALGYTFGWHAGHQAR